MQLLRRICASLSVLAFLLALGASARADEFHLKDGSKIVGTIVGYEDGAFRVETSYGFALVRKESIAEIIPAEKKISPDSGREAPALKPAALSAPAPNRSPAVLPMPAPRLKAANSAIKSDGAVANPAPPAPAAKSPSLSLPAISEPLPPAEALDAPPQPMQEMVRGNLYINQTYGFQLYKPPAWQLIENSQNELPNAIGALGTEDQSTLLVIGRDALKDSLQAHAAATERTLREVYENYRPLGTKQITIAGLPAIEERFYGSLDGHDWSVIVTTLGQGKEAFTILGMTSANSDLIQIQENVIGKTIASLQFISPQ
jgi:hypothetical protein